MLHVNWDSLSIPTERSAQDVVPCWRTKISSNEFTRSTIGVCVKMGLHRVIPWCLGRLAGDLTQADGHDEWVDVEDYIRTIKICAKIIVDWSN